MLKGFPLITLIAISLIMVIWSCNNPDKERLVYMDASDKYYVRTEKNGEGSDSNTLYVLYDFAEPSKIKAAGFLKDSFRNGIWNYNIEPDVKTIRWGYYKDNFLDFETNVFARIDNIQHGDFFTKFLFEINNDRVILNVSINGPFKDSLPQIIYKRITEDDLTKIGVQAISFQSRKIVNGHNEIYLSEIKGKTVITDDTRIIRNAFCFLDENHFIEYSVTYSNENNVDATILFNAVLTNFFIDGKRLYDPLVPSAVSCPNWMKSKEKLN
jgi:hypothetical protein